MSPDRGERRSVDGAEQALIGRMLAGDEAAFEQFAADYLPPLYRFAQRRLGDRELTRDVVQSTLVKAIAKLGTFRGEAALSTWLCACCRNEIAAHFRQRSREGFEVELSDEIDSSPSAPWLARPAGPEQSMLMRERAELVHEALDLLPPHYARALEWKYLERLPVQEIATRLGMGAKAAESMLTRARDAFRKVHAGLSGAARESAATGLARFGAAESES